MIFHALDTKYPSEHHLVMCALGKHSKAPSGSSNFFDFMLQDGDNMYAGGEDAGGMQHGMDEAVGQRAINYNWMLVGGTEGKTQASDD